MSRPLSVCLYLMLSIFLSGCPEQQPGNAGKTTNKTASAPKKETSQPAAAAKPTNLLKASDGRSELTLPPHWIALGNTQSLNDEAKLQLASQQTSAAIAVFSDMKVDFDEMTLEKRNQQYMMQLSSSMKRIKRKIGPRQLVVNDMPALQYRTEFANPDGVNMVAILTSIEGEQCFYQVLYVSLLSEFDQEQPSLEAVLNSFHQTIKPLPPSSTPPVQPIPVAPTQTEPATATEAPGGVQPIPVIK